MMNDESGCNLVKFVNLHLNNTYKSECK